MVNSLKDSYRINKILKKITGIKFVGKQNKPDISETAQKSVSKYQQSKSRVSSQQRDQSKIQKSELSDKDRYVQYQKEVEAERLVGSGVQPDQPGKILKLPVNRKEIDLLK